MTTNEKVKAKEKEYVSYEAFKQAMDNLIDEYREVFLYFKNLFGDFSWTDLVQNIGKIYQIISALYIGTKTVSDELGLSDEELQKNYLAKYLDDLFEFENAFLESFDETVFRLLLSAIDHLFDSAKTKFDESSFASAVKGLGY